MSEFLKPLFPVAQPIPTSEILASLPREKSHYHSPRFPTLRLEALTKFTEAHVHGVTVGKARLLLIDQEHLGFDLYDQLPTELLYFLHLPETKSVVLEYFPQEVVQRIESNEVPHLGEVCRDLIKDAVNTEPLIYFEKIANQVRSSRKKLVTIDIANKATYEIYYTLFTVLAYLGPMLFLIFPSLPLLIAGLDSYVTEVQEKNGFGLFDKEEIHAYEQFLFSMEELRRIFLAAGLVQHALSLSREYGHLHDSEGIIPQSVAIYPKAHAIRAYNHMTNPSTLLQALNVAKRSLLRFPGLETTIRTYEYKNRLTKVFKNMLLSNWDLVSEEPIPSQLHLT